MPIAEPATMLTDYALAAVGILLGARLLGRLGTARRLFGAALAAAGAAAFVGGSAHGFAPHLGPESLKHLWQATYTLVGVANLLMLASAAVAALPPGPRAWAFAGLGVRLCAYLALVLPRRQFRYVVYDYALTLAVLLAFAAHGWVRRTQPAARWIVLGVAASALGAAVQHLRLAPHPQFNHNDLFHLVQALGLVLFYAGGRQLADHPP